MTSTQVHTRARGALGGLLAGLGFFGGIAATKATEKSEYPRPGTPPEEVQKYFTESTTAARLSVLGHAVSVSGLARFTGTVAGLAKRAGKGSGALRAAALTGGGFAVATQMLSASSTLLLTSKDNHLQTTKDLREVSYHLGGHLHGVGFGLLTGALGIAGLRSGELPKPVAIASLVASPLGILGPLTLLKKQTMVALPIGHLLSLLVSGAAGVTLARGSRPRQLTDGSAKAADKEETS
ncbi:hypothetical protein [Actinophytocola sp. NPDC049390]|uniref:hypothetical protein n=1 Tax=Actinophytocola sp. NPDC049390 TaxID=3363894 RepID=UPI0037B66794